MSLNAFRESLAAHLNSPVQDVVIPTPRSEEWKYFNISPVLPDSFEVNPVCSGTTATAGIRLAERSLEGIPQLKVLNGHVVGELPAGVRVLNPEEYTCPEFRDGFHHSAAAVPFADFARKLGREIIVLDAPDRGAGILWITLVTDSSAGDVIATPRVAINASSGSELAVLFTHHSAGAQTGMHFGDTEIYAQPGASVEVVRLFTDDDNSHCIESTTAFCSSNSKVRLVTVSASPAMVRNNTTAILAGRGAEAYLYGASLLAGNGNTDHHTIVDHAEPHCHSEELYKGVFSQNSVGTFNGKIFVRPHADKTTAYQSNHNLLLSPDARVNTKPQLEIWADDVKCSHGATTGRLDLNAMFYLRSRGLPETDAKQLLTHAFLAEAVEKTHNAAFREFLLGYVTSLLNQQSPIDENSILQTAEL